MVRDVHNMQKVKVQVPFWNTFFNCSTALLGYLSILFGYIDLFSQSLALLHENIILMLEKIVWFHKSSTESHICENHRIVLPVNILTVWHISAS